MSINGARSAYATIRTQTAGMGLGGAAAPSAIIVRRMTRDFYINAPST